MGKYCHQRVTNENRSPNIYGCSGAKCLPSGELMKILTEIELPCGLSQRYIILDVEAVRISQGDWLCTCTHTGNSPSQVFK